MLNKGKIYRLLENLTPPLIFKVIKSNPLYPWLSKKLTLLSTESAPQIVTLTKGSLSGFKLKLDPDGPWQHEMLSGDYDQELFEYLKQINLENKIIYDIGAHIGYHSLVFSKSTKTGRIYAFEPNPTNYNRAKDILDLNPELKERITLFDVALSNEVGTMNFLSTADIEMGSSTGGFLEKATPLRSLDQYIEKSGFKNSVVKTETIDNLILKKHILPPNILKIDVEGAEQLVLEGAKNTIASSHPIIIVEFHSIFATYACLSILSEFKYTTQILKRETDGRIMIVAI